MNPLRAIFVVPVRSAPYLAAGVRGLVAMNVRWLRDHPETPPLYRSGVRYKREAVETWMPIPIILRRGGADCEDLASWRVAELRASGVDPKARVHVYKTKHRTFHAIVERGNGKFEDPSAKLGMKRRA